jgi:hypothetical protein
MNAIENVSRRSFLKGMASAGALVLGLRYYPKMVWASDLPKDTHADLATLHPNVFVGIDTDGTVWIIAHRSEMGTIIRTTLPLVVADELDADWKKVKIDQAIGDPRYGDQNTDGSHSIRSFYDVMRQAGATARFMLIQARRETADPRSGTIAAQIEKFLALCRERHGQLRSRGAMHGQSGIRHGRPSGWDGLCLHRASTGSRRQSEILR